MSYLGSNEVAFRLGNQAVSVYLGAVEVYSPSATLYFNGAVDDDWATLGNWWQDADHTVAASALPTAADSVIMTAAIFSNSESQPTVVNVTLDTTTIDIEITVTGMATFNNFSFNEGTINGNATFNDGSVNNGTVTGTVTVNS